MTGRITIAQIAELAGVSKAVVSAVVNGKENQKIYVSAQKKRLILDVIEKFHYVPQKSARDLSARRTDRIGLIVQRLTPMYAHLLECMYYEAERRGLDVLPYLTDATPAREEAYLAKICDGRVDGIIVAGPAVGAQKLYKRLTAAPFNMKIVSVDREILPGIPSVKLDEQAVGKIAARTLVEKKRPRLAVVGGAQYADRRAAFLRECKKLAGAKPLVHVMDGNAPGRYCDILSFAEKILARGRVPDGIFALDDLVAVALLSAAARRGLRVPADLAVVSCDNTEVCDYVHPPISSVDTRVPERVKIALDLFQAMMSGRKCREHRKIMPVLVKRESTG